MNQPRLDIALHLLATGLVEAIDAREHGREQWVVNSKLVQALNHICAYQILRDGFPTVGGTHDLYRKAHERLGAIDPDLVDWAEEDDPLLVKYSDKDEPTSLCGELSMVHRDIVGDIQQRVIMQVRSLATALGRPDLYSEVRLWTSKNPIVTRGFIDKACNESEALGLARGHLEKFYELVPVARQLNLCSTCGLQYDPDGCARPMCSPWTPPQDDEEDVYRVNRGTAIYLVRPALAELWLFDQLTELGLEPELYPGYDAYDIRVVVSDKVLAIDVKDVRSAKQLALRLNNDTIPPAPPWSEAYFVLPPWRDSEHYRHGLQVHLKPGISLLWATELIERIKEVTGK